MYKKFSKELNIIRKDPKLILTLPIAFFILLLLRPFKKLFFFRFGFLHSDRIGHFAMNTELSILEDKKFKNKSTYDFYYFGGKICNIFLGKKWSELLNIFPKIFIRPFCLISRRLNIFKHNIAGSTLSSDNDVMNLLEKYPSQIRLNKEETKKGFDILKSIGVNKKSKIVCLIVRDEGYLTKIYGSRQNYHNFRNLNIKLFEKSVTTLINNGYHVFRMGDHTKSKLKISNKNYFDYSKSKIKSDFMDIFLGYSCSFCVSTNTGFDALPWIFRKPILFVGSMPIGIFNSNSKKIMVTTKTHYSKKKKKILTLQNIFEENLAYSLRGEDFTNKRVKLLDLSAQEINKSTIDMLNYIDNNFKLSKKNEKINKLFWKKYEALYLKYLPKKQIHGKIKCKISPSFIKKNRKWLLNG
jgi:putative glycosyltransferase (TIGR04372 family)